MHIGLWEMLFCGCGRGGKNPPCGTMDGVGLQSNKSINPNDKGNMVFVIYEDYEID